MGVVALLGLTPENWTMLQNIAAGLALYLAYSIRGAFKAGMWFKGTDHTKKFKEIDDAFISVREDCNKSILSLKNETDKSISGINGQINLANDNYSRLSGFTQSLPDRADRQMRALLKDYVLDLLFKVHIEESKNDRRQLWTEITSIRRELNDVREHRSTHGNAS